MMKYVLIYWKVRAVNITLLLMTLNLHSRLHKHLHKHMGRSMSQTSHFEQISVTKLKGETIKSINKNRYGDIVLKTDSGREFHIEAVGSMNALLQVCIKV